MHYMEYVEDKNNNLNAALIQSSAQLRPLSKSSFGLQNYLVWTKLTLRNTTANDRSFVLYNIISGADDLSVYYLRDDKIIQMYRLGDTLPFTTRPIPNRHIAVPLMIASNEELTIITRLDNRTGLLNLEWTLMDPNTYTQFYIHESMFFGAFAGVIFAFVIYNLMIYFSLRKSAFLFYTMYGISLFCYQYLINSVFYEWQIFDAGILNDLKHPVGFSIILFILLFNMEFFETRKNFKRIHRASKVLIWITLALIVSISFSLHTPWFHGVNVFGHCFVIVSLVYLWIAGIYFIIQKQSGALFYTLGQGVFFLAATYHILGSMGFVESNFIYRYINIEGIILDMIFLSMALGQRLKILNQEKENNEKVLLLTSRFASMGQVVGNITHQWKIPLARLGSLLMELEAKAWANSKNIKEEIETLIPKMRDTIRFMDDTIHELSEFYKSDNHKVTFSINKQLTEVKELLSAKCITLDAKIEIDPSCEFNYFGFKNAFGQVAMIIIDNALDIGKARTIKSPIIKIYKIESKKGFLLCIEDNCGGIKQHPIETIFELFSSNETDNNSGMGLVIAKKICESKLGGALLAENTPDGALFSIKLDPS